VPAGTFENVTWPLEFVVPGTLIDIGPPLSVTEAPLAAVPLGCWTVTTNVPTGIATGTVVVLPPVTETLVAVPVWLLFVALTVMPDPAGTLEIVTWPLELVVLPAVIVPTMLPPVTVTVAPETGVVAHVTVAAIEPVGMFTVTGVVTPPLTETPVAVPV